MDFNIKPNKPVRQDGGMPQTIEQLIKKYKLDSMWEEIQQIVMEVIEQNSGYVIKKDGVMYIADNNVLEDAKTVLRIGKNFLDISNNGIEGNYQTIISLDGIINANFIQTGEIDANIVNVKNINANNIKSGEIDANRINVKNINADNITVGNLNANRIKGGVLTLGGNNNTNGELKIIDKEGKGIATISKDGFILQNGTQLIGANGILSNLQFGQFEWKNVGYSTYYMPASGEYLYIKIPIFIPNNFNIESAKVTLYHSPIRWAYNSTIIWGYCRNLKLYIREEGSNYYQNNVLRSEQFPENDLFTNEISNAFGENGFTGKIPSDSSHSTESKVSIDIKSHLKTNTNIVLQIRSGNAIPTLNPDIGDIYQRNYLNQTANVKAIVNIIGKMK